MKRMTLQEVRFLVQEAVGFIPDTSVFLGCKVPDGWIYDSNRQGYVKPTQDKGEL